MIDNNKERLRQYILSLIMNFNYDDDHAYNCIIEQEEKDLFKKIVTEGMKEKNR